MKRFEFSIVGSTGQTLDEPGLVEECFKLPLAIMRAVEDFLEANGNEKALLMSITVRAAEPIVSC